MNHSEEVNTTVSTALVQNRQILRLAAADLEDGLVVSPAKALDSCLWGDKVPLGSSLPKPKKRLIDKHINWCLLIYWSADHLCMSSPQASSLYHLSPSQLFSIVTEAISVHFLTQPGHIVADCVQHGWANKHLVVMSTALCESRWWGSMCIITKDWLLFNMHWSKDAHKMSGRVNPKNELPNKRWKEKGKVKKK